MDFETAPLVKEAILKRAEHGVFGYTDITPEWYSAYQSWWKDRHGFEMEKEWLIFTTGVVPAISSIVRKMTTVAENVVVMTPVYNIFFNSILNNGRNVLESRLKYENGTYQIDFADLEEKTGKSADVPATAVQPAQSGRENLGQSRAGKNRGIVSETSCAGAFR